ASMASWYLGLVRPPVMAYGRTSGWSPSPPYGAWWEAPYGPGEAGGGVIGSSSGRGERTWELRGGKCGDFRSPEQAPLQLGSQVRGEDGACSVDEKGHLVADEAD